MPPPVRARIDQTARALLCLQREIRAWIDAWVVRDQQRQYQTQLTSLRVVLDRAFTWLENQLNGLDGASGIGTVYRKCRGLDSGLMVVHRVWAYYRDKFDQRKDPLFQSVLTAADEIVWSCYAQAFPGHPNPPAPSVPLPFLSPEATPLARPRSESPFLGSRHDPQTRTRGATPAEWRDTDDDLIRAFRDILSKMPIPIIALPYSCVQAPWELILLAHEVGHHVQFDLAPRKGPVEKGQVEKFQTWLGNELGSPWDKRADEVFADVFSLYSVGAWGVWALAALEVSDPISMLRPTGQKGEYPPPLVRLAFLVRFAERLKLSTNNLLATFGAEPEQYTAELLASDPDAPQLWTAAETELQQVGGLGAGADPPLIAAAERFVVERQLPGDAHPRWKGKLIDLCDFRPTEFGPLGFVSQWAKVLRKDKKGAEEGQKRVRRQQPARAAAGGERCGRRLDRIRRAGRRGRPRGRTRRAAGAISDDHRLLPRPGDTDRGRTGDRSPRPRG
jgi:hypothetical protein